MKNILFYVGCLVLMGCPREPVTVTTAQGCSSACVKLRTFSCSEGLREHCVDLCKEIVESGFLEVDFQCIDQAKNADELRTCGVCNP